MKFSQFFWILAAILVVSLGFIAAPSSPHPAQKPDLSDLSAITISLERTGCYGNCPSYTVTVKGDGTLEYVGKKNVKEEGARQGRVSEQVVKSILAEFERASFWSISDYSHEKCNCTFCTDMPSAITEIKVKDVTHRVDHYYGCRCAPKSLFDLEYAIDKVVNISQWTGDTSKSGPFGTTCFNKQ